MAFKQYEDPEVLREVQLACTRILGELDRVCRELDIPYVVYGGTAIGAVRHQGFIPWDDDVDVCLARRDYERFLREAPAVLGAEFSIENARTRDHYPNMFTKLALRGTQFIPEFCKDCTYRMPVAIDLMPFDNVPDDPAAYRRQSRETWVWGRLIYLRASGRPFLTLTGWKRTLALTASLTAHWGMRLLRVSPRWLQARWEKAARRYEHDQTELMADYCDQNPLAWAVRHDDLFPAVDVPFEDITVKLPREYDAILTQGYGDYMQLPPVEQRKNHQPHHIDLGPA